MIAYPCLGVFAALGCGPPAADRRKVDFQGSVIKGLMGVMPGISEKSPAFSVKMYLIS
jgi:hypothetical protein